MTAPFTYRVTHRPSGTWYYGVRYAKGCHPNDLWKNYYTSSSAISKLLSEDGADNFVTEIRKTFSTPQKARDWELRVLRRIIGLPLCLNQNAFPAVTEAARARGNAKKRVVGTDGLTIFQKAGHKWKHKKNLIEPISGKTYGELRREKFNAALDRNGTRSKSEELRMRLRGQNNPACRADVRQKISATLKAHVKAGTHKGTTGMKFPSISEKLKGNQACTGKKWYNDGVKDIRLLSSDSRVAGLKQGRLRVGNKGYCYTVITCPHCGKEGAGGGMKRYHFDACRFNPPSGISIAAP